VCGVDWSFRRFHMVDWGFWSFSRLVSVLDWRCGGRLVPVLIWSLGCLRLALLVLERRKRSFGSRRHFGGNSTVGRFRDQASILSGKLGFSSFHGSIISHVCGTQGNRKQGEEGKEIGDPLHGEIF